MDKWSQQDLKTFVLKSIKCVINIYDILFILWINRIYWIFTHLFCYFTFPGFYFTLLFILCYKCIYLLVEGKGSTQSSTEMQSPTSSSSIKVLQNSWQWKTVNLRSGEGTANGQPKTTRSHSVCLPSIPLQK